jgi:Domain of unknown function (DUF4407)
MAALLNGGQNGLYTYDQFNGNKKKKERNAHFLCWCAGAHQELLNEYPTEHTRQAGLGGVVLATFALASLSAGYAIYSVFDSLVWAILFGCIWGLIIFNFDRFLVSTMRKYGVSASKQIWMTLPRILLALLIGITIARPLELKIFEKEIDIKVVANRHKKMLANDSLLQLESNRELVSAESERNRLAGRKGALEDSLRFLQAAYVQEADGTGGSRQRGIDRLTKLKQEAYQAASIQYNPELQQLARQIAYQDSLLTADKANTELKRKQYEATLADKVGFLERNKALSDLSSEENSVWWADFFISLLIILIETGPILSKLIMNPGPYDVALAKTELIQMAQSEDEMKRHKQLRFDKQGSIYQKKKEMSDEMMEKLHALQRKHVQREIEQWEEGGEPGPKRSALNDLVKKIKEQYDYEEDRVL